MPTCTILPLFLTASTITALSCNDFERASPYERPAGLQRVQQMGAMPVIGAGVDGEVDAFLGEQLLVVVVGFDARMILERRLNVGFVHIATATHSAPSCLKYLAR